MCSVNRFFTAYALLHPSNEHTKFLWPLFCCWWSSMSHLKLNVLPQHSHKCGPISGAPAKESGSFRSFFAGIGVSSSNAKFGNSIVAIGSFGTSWLGICTSFIGCEFKRSLNDSVTGLISRSPVYLNCSKSMAILDTRLENRTNFKSNIDRLSTFIIDWVRLLI